MLTNLGDGVHDFSMTTLRVREEGKLLLPLEGRHRPQFEMRKEKLGQRGERNDSEASEETLASSIARVAL